MDTERKKRLIDIIETKELDGILLFSGRESDKTLLYLFGFDMEACTALIKKDGSITILVSEMMLSQYEKELVKNRLDVELVFKKDKFLKMLEEMRIGINYLTVPYASHQELKKHAKRISDVSQELEVLRMVKSAEEVKKIKKAGEITKLVIERATENLFEEQMREKELARKILVETYQLGAEPAFSPIVATGGNACHPHAKPGARKIKRYVLIDYGVKYDGYCYDFCDCYFENAQVDERYLFLRDFFVEILEFLKENRCDSCKLAQFYVKKMNQKGYKILHSLGHGVGLEVHEAPFFRIKGRSYRLENTTIAIEPGVYIGRDGFRFERSVYLDGKINPKVLWNDGV